MPEKPSLPTALENICEVFEQDKQLIPAIFLEYNLYPYDFNRHFHKETIENHKTYILRMLRALAVPHNKYGRFLNVPLTLYDLVKELSELKGLDKRKRPLINYLLQALNKKDRYREIKIILAGVALGLFIWIIPPLLQGGIVEVLQTFLETILLSPILGCLLTGGIAIYRFYQNLRMREKPVIQQIRDNLFLIATTALNITAYSLLIVSGAISPITVTLFLVSSFVKFTRELVNLLSIYFGASPSYENNYYKQQHQARYENNLKKATYKAMIDLTGSMIFLGLMIAWCFIPGGFAVSLTIISSMILVWGVSNYLHRRVGKHMQDSLNAEFARIEEQLPDDAVNDDMQDDTYDFRKRSLSLTDELLFGSRSAPLREPQRARSLSMGDISITKVGLFRQVPPKDISAISKVESEPMLEITLNSR